MDSKVEEKNYCVMLRFIEIRNKFITKHCLKGTPDYKYMNAWGDSIRYFTAC